MENTSYKKNLTTLAIILALVLIAAAFGWYRSYRLGNEIVAVKTAYDNKVSELETSLSNSEYEKKNLSEALENEMEKNEDFEREIEKIAGKVGILEKLSQTDPELLQKYSKVFFLNEHYIPKRLSSIESKYLFNPKEKEQIHASVETFMERMIDRANRDDMNLKIVSAFRSFGTQATLKSQYKVIYGAGSANQFSADQGYSEHQLGTTLDLTSGSSTGALSTAFDKTAEFKWLKDNAHKYGFVLSYPPGNAYYQYEPWHWRFVGIDLATDLHKDKKYFYDLDQRDIDKYLIKLFEL